MPVRKGKLMQRFWKLLAILAAFALLAAACGDDDEGGGEEPVSAEDGAAEDGAAEDGAAEDGAAEDGAAEDGAADEAAAGDDEAAAGGGDEVTLRWRTRPDNQAEIDVYQAISDDLAAASSSFELTYEPGGSETSSYQDVLKTELASGTAPDVFWIPGTDIADFVGRGLLLDLREQADGAGHSDEDFYPGPMFHLTYNPETGNPGETLWGLPRDVSTFAMYVNLDLIAEAGAEDPRDLAASGDWTWETFSEVVADVAALGGEVKGFGSDSWWGPYGVWINGAGGSFFTDDRTACALDSDESLAGLTFANELFTSGNTLPWGEGAEAPFQAGTLGMYMNGRWATPGMRAANDFNWDVVNVPAGPAGASNWLFWGAYVVNAETEHPEAAWELVQALTTAETQGTISELGANIPSRVGQDAIDAFLTFTPPENNQAFIDGISTDAVAEGPLWDGSWPDFDAAMGSAVSAVIAGDTTVEAFADTICAEVDSAAFG
jgi:multiple sugar transport system substrate-binding protein